MAQENSISQELADLLVTNNFDPEYRDEGGQSSGPGDANTISFDYRSTSGNNYGSAVAVIGDDNELMLFFGDNLGRSMQDQDKDEWFGFLNQMRKLAQSHRYSFSPQNLSRLKHSLAGQAAVKEGLFEGYYGSRRESFIGEPTEARILIKHNKIIGEDDKRYRYIESIFIETADGERFKLQSNRLIHGRAMLEHVRSGGRPYDVRGNHINEMVQELSVLSRFNRAKQHHVYEGITQELVESAAHYYRSLQENLKRLSSSRGYHTYFESWAPDQIDQQESLVEDLKNMFVQQTLDTRIEAALPTLAKIQQQGTKMKEAEIFENYMNRLSEGTWALPDTPEAYEKLQQLMTGELIVGADAMNATEQLYDLVGDDELFDILNDLADKSQGRANCWDDSDVQRRLAELGIQTPQSTQAEPADVDQDEAPPVAEGQLDEIGDTPAGQAALQKYKDKAHNQVAAHWKQVHNKSYLPTDPKMANRNAGAMSAGNRIHGYGIDKNQQDRVTGRFKYRDAVGLSHVYQKNDPLEQGMAEGEISMDNPGKLSNQEYKDSLNQRYGQPDLDTSRMNKQHQDFYDKNPSFKQSGKEIVTPGDGRLASKVVPAVTDTKVGRIPMNTPGGSAMRGGGGMGGGTGLGGRRPGDDSRINPLKLENAELATMLKYAGVPLQEGVLTDSTGNKMEHIKDTYQRDIKDFTQSGDMSKHLYHALHDYYFDDMPYGAKTGDDIDPHEWISDRFAEDLGINENLISPMIMPVSEGSCNMTAEGSYCPEHGLAECGGMYEDEYIPRVEIRGFGPDFEDLPAGKKLINPMQPRRHNELSPLTPGDSSPMPPVANVDLTVDEGNDDPINSNSAMTGSYYEGKEYQSQEGDALLARIKSLALLR